MTEKPPKTPKKEPVYNRFESTHESTYEIIDDPLILKPIYHSSTFNANLYFMWKGRIGAQKSRYLLMDAKPCNGEICELDEMSFRYTKAMTVSVANYIERFDTRVREKMTEMEQQLE